MLASLHVHNNNLTTNATVSSFQHFGHSLNTVVAIVISSYFIFLIVGGVMFNAVLIHIILHIKKRFNSSINSFVERQQSTTNIFIVNLAVCDLLTAILTLPFEADFLLRGYYAGGIIICGLKETFFMFSLPTSVVNLLLLTIERFVKILYPFKHRRLFTTTNVTLLISASWTYVLVIALLPIMVNHKSVVIEHGVCAIHLSNPYIIYQLVGNFTFPLLLILTMNIILYKTVGKRLRESESQRQRHSSALPQNFRTAKTVMSMVGVFLVCWLTFIISVSVNIMCGVCLPREATWFVNAVNYSSVALDPIIYGLQNKSIRKVLLKTFFRYHENIDDSRKRTSMNHFGVRFRKHSSADHHNAVT